MSKSTEISTFPSNAFNEFALHMCNTISLKKKNQGWKDDPAVKSIGRSSRRPNLISRIHMTTGTIIQS